MYLLRRFIYSRGGRPPTASWPGGKPPWRSRDLGGVPKLGRPLMMKKEALGPKEACGYTCPALQRWPLMRRQFEDIKRQYPNYILLFQVGEFYELYGEDASTCHQSWSQCSDTCLYISLVSRRYRISLVSRRYRIRFTFPGFVMLDLTR